jgi:hypothetical protein
MKIVRRIDKLFIVYNLLLNFSSFQVSSSPEHQKGDILQRCARRGQKITTFETIKILCFEPEYLNHSFISRWLDENILVSGEMPSSVGICLFTINVS